MLGAQTLPPLSPPKILKGGFLFNHAAPFPHRQTDVSLKINSYLSATPFFKQQISHQDNFLMNYLSIFSMA